MIDYEGFREELEQHRDSVFNEFYNYTNLMKEFEDK